MANAIVLAEVTIDCLGTVVSLRSDDVRLFAAFSFRATSGTRTLDPSFTKAVLYRLS